MYTFYRKTGCTVRQIAILNLRCLSISLKTSTSRRSHDNHHTKLSKMHDFRDHSYRKSVGFEK